MSVSAYGSDRFMPYAGEQTSSASKAPNDLERISSLVEELTLNDFPLVHKQLRELPYDSLLLLGVDLGINVDELSKLDIDDEKFRVVVVNRWLSKADNVLNCTGVPTWSNLIVALNGIDENRLAQYITQSIQAGEMLAKIPEHVTPKASNTLLDSSDFCRVSDLIGQLCPDDYCKLFAMLGLAQIRIADKKSNLFDLIQSWLDCCDQVLSHSKYPCFNVLAQALYKIGQLGLAEDVSKQYPAVIGETEVPLTLAKPSVTLNELEDSQLKGLLERDVKDDFKLESIARTIINGLSNECCAKLCNAIGMVGHAYVSNNFEHLSTRMPHAWKVGSYGSDRLRFNLKNLKKKLQEIGEGGKVQKLERLCREYATEQQSQTASHMQNVEPHGSVNKAIVPRTQSQPFSTTRESHTAPNVRQVDDAVTPKRASNAIIQSTDLGRLSVLLDEIVNFQTFGSSLGIPISQISRYPQGLKLLYILDAWINGDERNLVSPKSWHTLTLQLRKYGINGVAEGIEAQYPQGINPQTRTQYPSVADQNPNWKLQAISLGKEQFTQIFVDMKTEELVKIAVYMNVKDENGRLIPFSKLSLLNKITPYFERVKVEQLYDALISLNFNGIAHSLKRQVHKLKK
ncbi:hypothetical protein D5R81_19685 [Parashewanella spongiae]|uniref:Death domain-containing protein n=1 Tax=Parashewanella spongiae TaxID=342950 RepID=A0A3A6STK2_9GAMM|nr:hypothetical protein [Parashewanella spongiae]MCL1078186.1 hypothetical protein [Parashewanella spongiae]RJY01896.1 hypothetical protein D5R81_19685 [Parashewanella spongiae]